MFDITPIVKALFALMGAVVVYILIPYIKSKSTVEQQQSINGWIKIAVSAAEQLYAGSGRGEEKKTYLNIGVMPNGSRNCSCSHEQKQKWTWRGWRSAARRNAG